MRKNRVLKKIILYTILLIVYKLTLEIVYRIYIYPIFMYTGFNYEFELVKYLAIWVIFLFFVPSIIKIGRQNTLSSGIMLIFLMVGLLPGLVLYSFMDVSISFLIYYLSYWSSMILIYNAIPIILFKKIQGKSGQTLIYLFTFFFIVVVLYLSGKYAGFRINLDLLNVYDLRLEMREKQIPRIFSYLFSAIKVLNPLLFVFFLQKRKYIMASVIFVCQILAFSIDGSKSTFFSIVIVYVIYRFLKNITVDSFFYLLPFSVISSLLEPLLVGSTNIVILLIRRAFFVPNLLNIYYFDFFSDNPKDIFKQGILGRFGFDSTYDIAIPNLIGLNYFNDSTTAANNGLVSDAFSNLGWIGVILMPVLIVIFLKVLDGITSKTPTKFLFPVMITGAYTFISSSFFTVLMTHGLLFTGVVLWFLSDMEFNNSLDELDPVPRINVYQKD